MGLQAGSKLGPYEILTPLGHGGMGEVYRARDSKLQREVAIKVLPEHLARDADRLDRLRREAQLLAALNNPHIAHIHGLEDESGAPALVLELVEGSTLAERITDGPLPFSESIEIARQIADALEAAHEKGIIHRDLKPANVKITPDGTVKVLDFGLAKAVSSDQPGRDLSMVTTANTEAGVVLGTAAYMSPEQARGRPVDKRTDIWAFGCVLFEMLSGHRPFAGDTLSDTIAGILTREPDWRCLPSDLPANIAVLLRRCLEKDNKRRLRDIGDARIELEDGKVALTDSVVQQQPAAVTRRTAIAALAGAAAGAAATALTIRQSPTASPRQLTRFAIAMPEGEVHRPSFNSRLGISRNGRFIAFNTVTGGSPRLYTRSLEDLQSNLIKEAPGGYAPFFSPDDRWLGFYAMPGLRRAALTGGAPVTVCTVFGPGFGGATWADDGTIYLVAENPGGLQRVPSAGGQPVEIAPIDAASGDFMFKFPQALPGSRAVLLTVASASIDSFDDASIAVVSVDSGSRKVLIEGGTFPKYTAGHLLYARNGALVAVRFDPDRLEVTGRPFTVMEGVLMSRNTGQANFDVADTGDLVFIPGDAEGGARTLVWVDRNGKAENVPLPARSFLHPRLSPDGRKLAIEIEGSSHDVYVYDFASGVLSNITTDGISHWPVWSADGRDIGYRSGPMGRFQLWQVPADRSRAPRQVQASGVSQSAGSYSPDGRTIAYTAAGESGPPKVTLVSLEGDGSPRPLDDSKYAQGSPKFSPDGRWLAYCSNESGRPEVYVQALPGPGAKIQVSNDGGTDPVWRRSGGELFYRNGDSMMAVSVTTSPSFTSSRPRELWKGHYSHGMSSSCGPAGPTSSNYDVTADGERFLMVKDDDQDTAVSRQIVVVQGWAEELGRLSKT
jgi:Tol biopolymer transport system component/tRNA A-37 threonylcarbamoyl transferase component Bud32